jgi:tellurite resistance protein
MASSNDEGNYGCLIIAAILGLIWCFSKAPIATVILVAIAIVLWVYFSSEKKKKNEARIKNPRGHINLRGNIANKSIGGESLRFLEVQIEGTFPQTIYQPQVDIELKDITPGKAGHPIISLIEAFQASNSAEFEYIQTLDDPIYDGSSLNWGTVGGIPIDLLSFAHSGDVTLSITLSVYDRSKTTRPLIVTSTAQIILKNSTPGYEDAVDHINHIRGCMIQLALYVASSDGHTDQSEIQVIKDWGKKMVKAVPDHLQDKARSSINEALQKATDMIRRGRQHILLEKSTEELVENAERSALYEAYDLCLEVVQADGEAHPEEMAVLTQIARRLDLDEDTAKSMSHKQLAGLHFSHADSADGADKLLGITADMSKEKIRKHLGKEFRIWNGRVNHDDSDTREEAKLRLQMIAEARTRHLKS